MDGAWDVAKGSGEAARDRRLAGALAPEEANVHPDGVVLQQRPHQLRLTRQVRQSIVVEGGGDKYTFY